VKARVGRASATCSCWRAPGVPTPFACSPFPP